MTALARPLMMLLISPGRNTMETAMLRIAMTAAAMLFATFSTNALANERSAADELLMLEKYRFNESKDITRKRTYRFGRMDWKILHLAWEIAKEVKQDKPDELLALEKYRFSESKDITRKRTYRFGRMDWKTLHLVWEIIKDLKENLDSGNAHDQRRH